MLLLRCSLAADSMSRSINFWPSTIATLSSSAWVALNSMRFMNGPRRDHAAGRRGRQDGGRVRDFALASTYAAVAREDEAGAGARRGRARDVAGMDGFVIIVRPCALE